MVFNATTMLQLYLGGHFIGRGKKSLKIPKG
jgi:hypothetical protein